MGEYEVGMKGELMPTTFGQTTEIVNGKMEVIRRAIECEIVEVYEHFVVCEFDAPLGVKIRECFCKTDGKLRETVWKK